MSLLRMHAQHLDLRVLFLEEAPGAGTASNGKSSWAYAAIEDVRKNLESTGYPASGIELGFDEFTTERTRVVDKKYRRKPFGHFGHSSRSLRLFA